MSTNVLIVDDEENARKNIGEYLTAKGYEVTGAGTLREARDLINTGVGDVILLDVQLPDGYGPNLLYEVNSLPARPPIIVITGYGDIEMAVDVMKNGAHDFLTKPINMQHLEQSIERAQEIVAMRRELAYLREKQSNINFVVGKSDKMKTVIEHAVRAAQASVSVLITGETGTGKEVLAQFIHKSGPRSSKQFVAINCAAIQPTVLESELFGHEKGAFTGADVRKHGLMEIADSGVLFLDEISKMPLEMQSKLLRAVEEKSIRRVGGTSTNKIDIQIVSASNRDLKKMMSDGEFREDLYYRLKVVDLELPPLRERKEDIPELVGFFIREQNARQGLNISDISPRALQALTAYDWPGNIRELSHVIERAMLFCDDPVLDLNHLPSDVTRTK
ncbi:sigma-54-dependent Fis family transcriptional regulator [Leptolinea sp. HRD-7]|nr:sigma-54-dependent Fis family transcriptional regulator [Leptolinea sp. HRD-7]